MAKRIEYGRYYITTINGQPKVTWTEKKEDGTPWRPRHALNVPDNANPAELRAALIAFATKYEADQLRAKAVTVADILDAYQKDRERDGKVIENIKANIKQLTPFFGKMAPQDISDDACREFTRESAKDGKTGSTVLTYLSRLRAALKWAVAKKVMPAENMPSMWFPQASAPRDRILTDDEVTALLDTTTGHLHLFVMLCLLTGGRTSAILELTWDRVDFDAGTIDLKVPRQVDILKKEVKKGRARVHMADTLRAALLKAKGEATNDKTGTVIEWKGQPVKSVKIALRKAMKRAEIAKGASAHTLRHTAATWSEEGLLPDTHTAKLLGHKNVKTTEHYKHGATKLTEGPVKAIEARLKTKPRLRVVNSSDGV